MTSVYDEIEIEDFDYDPDVQTFYYPCPCGDRFQVSLVCCICWWRANNSGWTEGWRGDCHVSELFFDAAHCVWFQRSWPNFRSVDFDRVVSPFLSSAAAVEEEMEMGEDDCRMAWVNRNVFLFNMDGFHSVARHMDSAVAMSWTAMIHTQHSARVLLSFGD